MPQAGHAASIRARTPRERAGARGSPPWGDGGAALGRSRPLGLVLRRWLGQAGRGLGQRESWATGGGCWGIGVGPVALAGQKEREWAACRGQRGREPRLGRGKEEEEVRGRGKNWPMKGDGFSIYEIDTRA